MVTREEATNIQMDCQLGKQFQEACHRVFFAIFINDLDSNLISSVVKFVDDTKLFGRVNNDTVRDVILQDLSRLVELSDEWLLPFSISKCVVLHLVGIATIMNMSWFEVLSYESRLEHLRLWTTEERHDHSDLLAAFKLYKGMFSPVLQPVLYHQFS